MFKKHFNLLQKLGLTILLIFIVVCCAEEKCYTCEGYSGTLPMSYSNVCGSEMLKYYQNMGYSCYEESSTSNPVSSNIIVSNKKINYDPNLITIEDSECPCKNKEKIKIDESLKKD